MRPDPKARAVKRQDGAATRRHSVDAHHGRAHAHAGHLGLELALKLAGKVRHVGGSAAHVKANHPHCGIGRKRLARLGQSQLRGASHADNAARRAAEDGILAGKLPGPGQAARGLHKEQRHAGHLGRHLGHVAAQDGRQVGVHHRGVTAADQLHQRAGLVRGTDLGVAHRLGQPLGRLLVRGVAVAVQKNYRHTAQPLAVLLHQRRLQQRFIERLQQFAMGTNALVRLHHRAVQELGQLDVAVKNARPVLVSNAQCITKTARSHQQRGLALALQQRVGGHCGAHLDAGHLLWRNRLARLEFQQMTDASDCSVCIVLGVVAEQLVREQGEPAIGLRAAADDIGEGAASVYPELPFIVIYR